MESKKKTKGRQKLELNFKKNQKNHLVTFTKRQDGIFEKASELCTLVGINIAILITSLSGKTYSFVHPNIESVASQLLHQTLMPKGILESYREVHIKEINRQLEDLRRNLKLEEKRGMVLKEIRGERRKKVWEEPMAELTHDEAEKVKKHLRELQALIFNLLNEKYHRVEASHPCESSASNHM